MSKAKTVIVTGSSSGIGEAIARRFHSDGFNVVLNAPPREDLDRVVDALKNKRVLAIKADVSDRQAVADMIEQTVDVFGGIDVVVNNAGVAIQGTVDMLSDEDFDLMMNVNVKGVRYVSLAALPHLRISGGNIVNLSSVSGVGGDWGMYGYNASKGAVSLLTKAMALDLGVEGVRVNAVAPTIIKTPMTERLEAKPSTLEALARRIPMGRPGEPEEVASVVAFLAGPDAAFVNGVILPVDGGLMASNGQPNFMVG